MSKLLGRVVTCLAMAAAVAGVCIPATTALADDTGGAVRQEVAAGRLVIYKNDAETGLNEPQGGAAWGGDHDLGMDADSSAGEFTITNRSAKAIVYQDDYGHYHTYEPGESWTIRTHYDAATGGYVADTPARALPFGRYSVRETKAPAGYGLATDALINSSPTTLRYLPSFVSETARRWVNEGYEFTISEDNQVVTFNGETDSTAVATSGTGSYTAGPACYNPPFRSGIEAVKRDHDLRAPTAQGSATLTGTTYKIYNGNDHAVRVLDHFDPNDGHGVVATPTNGNEADENGMVAPGGLVATIVAGDDGRAQTFMDALPAGWYRVEEVTAPDGYELESWFANVQISGDDFDNLIVTNCDDPVIRGTAHVSKRDAHLEAGASGDGTLAGARLSIYYAGSTNRLTGATQPVVIHHTKAADGSYLDVSDNVYSTNMNGEAVHVVRAGGLVATVVTDENGDATLPGLPVGDYYVVEEGSPEGYTLNSTDKVPFTITDAGEVTADSIKNEPVGNISIDVQKVDSETGKPEARGTATLEGGLFAVYNSSKAPVTYDGNIINVGEKVCEARTDENGKVTFTGLQYGTYTVRELEAPRGYVTATEWAPVVVAHTADEVHNLTCADDIIREDIRFTKVDGNDMKPMKDVAFSLKSKTTGEEHILVTDEDGMLDTTAYMPDASTLPSAPTQWRMHTHDTNASDAAYNAETGAIDTTAAGFGFDHGYWFFGSKDAGDLAVTDTRAALPFDDYVLTELRCPANVGKALIQRDVTINRFNADVEDLGTITNNDARDNTVAPSGSVVDVTKSSSVAAGEKIGAGGTVTYTLSYTSTTYDKVGCLRIRDAVPAGFEFVSASEGGVNRDGYVEWCIPDVEPGATGSVTVTLRALPTAPSVVVNQAHFACEDTMPAEGEVRGEPVFDTNVTRNSVDGTRADSTIQAHLTADVPVTTPVHIGDYITYTVHVTNDGPDAVEQVGVYDAVPTGTELARTTNADGFEVDDISDGGELRNGGVCWNLGRIEAGATRDVTFRVRVTSSVRNSVDNSATFGTTKGMVTGALPATTNVVSHGLERVSDISLVKTASSNRVSAGEIVTYDVAVTNNGDGNATDVVVTDTLPSTVSYVKDSAVPAENATFDEATRTVTWTVPTLAHGETKHVTVAARISPDLAVGDVVTNVARTGDIESDPCNVTVVDAVNGLHIEKTSDAGPYVANGQEITYTIAWRNDGDEAISGLAIDDAIDKSTTFVPGSIVVTDATGATSADKPAEPETPETPADTPETPEATEAPATVWQPALTLNAVDADAVYNATVGKSDTRSIEDWDNVRGRLESAHAGDVIEFVVHDTAWYDVAWRAEVDETGCVRLLARILVPGVGDSEAYARVGGTSGSYDWSTGSVWTLVNRVEPGETGSVTFKVRVNDDVAADTEISNTFRYGAGAVSRGLSAYTHDGNTVVTRVGSPDLVGEKSVSAAAAGRGDRLTYTVRLTNKGNASAVNACVYDAIQHGDLTGVTLVPDSVSVSSGNVTSTLDEHATYVAANLGTIAPGDTATLTFDVTLEDVHPGDVVSNVATFDSGVTGEVTQPLKNTTDEVKTSITGDETANVIARVIQDKADGELVTPGATIHYRVTLDNVGSVAVNDAALFDEVPAGATLVDGSLKVDSALGESNVAATGKGFGAHVANLAAGASVGFEYDVKVNVGHTGIVINTPSYDMGVKSVPNGAQRRYGNDVDVLSMMPTLSIVKTQNPPSGSTVSIGDTVTYTVTVTNVGKVKASDVGIYDVVPDGTSMVEGSAKTTSGNVSYTASNKLVQDVVGDLGVNSSVTCSFSVKVDPTAKGTIHNRAMWVSPSSAVTIRNGAAPSAAIGGLLSWLMPTRAYAADVTDIIDVGGATSGTSDDAQPTQQAQPTTPSTSGGSASTEATVGETSGASTTAAATEGASDSASSNEVEAIVGAPDISVVKSVTGDDNGVVHKGDVIRYALDITNNGDGTVNGLTVLDSLPDGFAIDESTLVATDITCDFDGSTIVGHANLEPGAHARITFAGTVTADSGDIVNGTQWGISTDGGTPTELHDGDNSVTVHVEQGETPEGPEATTTTQSDDGGTAEPTKSGKTSMPQTGQTVAYIAFFAVGIVSAVMGVYAFRRRTR